MSYILEALKKSDRERKQGKVPTLETMEDRVERRSHGIRSRWPLVLLGFLALGGVIFGAWRYRREPPPVPTAPTEVVAPATPSREASIPANDTSAPPALPTVTEKPEAPANQTQATPAINLDKTTTTKAVTAPQVTTPTADDEIAPPPDDETAAPAGDEPLEPATSAETAPDDQVEELSPPPTETEEPRIVKLEDLPAELQDELPEIKIGVHLYSENPEARRASINGRLLREGQLVGPGLQLEEITRQGAILSFRGRKFSVAVFPR